MNVTRKDSHCILHIARDLIYNHFSDIVNTVNTVIKEDVQLVVLDMSGVEYISGKGIDLILDIAEKVRGSGRDIKITGLRRPLVRLFDLTGVCAVIEIVRDSDHGMIDINAVSDFEKNMIRDFF